LEWARVGREAAQRTTALLGAQKPPTGSRSVVFDPWVAGEFLDLVAGLLCADQVQRGKSLLAGKLGQSVGSSVITFVDDPRRAGGLASSLFDDEGAPTQRKTMIEGGVVKEFFYDAYTAAREKRASNASAGRGSYRGLPSPGCTNFFLAPGKMTREALLSSTEDGLLVLDVMGMHMADPISGEFSVGVSGLLIEKGKLAKPVKAAMISGNLLELLGRVDAVADDLTFYGGMGAPTFRVSHMTVA
jgi:PmbA protein